MTRKSFILYADSLAILSELTDEEVGRVFRAISSYAIGGEAVALSKVERIAFLPIKNYLDRDSDKWEDVIEKRRAAGSMGGKQKVANASKSKQDVANLADNVNVSVNDNVNVNESVSVNESDNEDTSKAVKQAASRSRKRSVSVETRGPEGQPDYLISIPADDLASLQQKFDLSAEAVTAKAEELYDWLQSKKRQGDYKDFRAFLRNALRRDADKLRAAYPNRQHHLPDDVDEVVERQSEIAYQMLLELQAKEAAERQLTQEAHGD